MGRWVTLGLDNLNGICRDKTFRDEVTDEFYGPLLASLVGGLKENLYK